MQQQQEYMAAMDAQYKALQESAEETARIREWEKMDTELKLRQYDGESGPFRPYTTAKDETGEVYFEAHRLAHFF